MPASRLAMLVLIVTLAACGRGESPPAPNPAATAAAVDAARAANDFETYEQLRKLENFELAARYGRQILAKYPGTPGAASVQQTLGETETKAKTIGEKRRLQQLWTYQSGVESGGKQNTAAIYSSGDRERIRLILRRHVDWGQSAYLFGSGAGFECGKPCTLTIRYDDGSPQRVAATLPTTGEPAIFIEDDAAFLARLQKSRVVVIEAMPKGGRRIALTYEVGGFDAAKFPPLAKK